MRDNIFQNIVNDENSFTELLCNMMRYDKFKKIFFEFIDIKDSYKFECETQCQTNNNGRPDFVIHSENDFILIEIKTGDTNLTGNQPKGYIKELCLKPIENKKLIFILPRGYKYEKKLNTRIEKYNKKNILIDIKYWDVLFELLKKNNIDQINDICMEYYNLIKNWYGYEHIQFYKKENNKMDKLEIGKFVNKIEEMVETIGDLLVSNGYKIKHSKVSGDFGFSIFDKKNVELCWFGAWISLWAKTGDVVILTLSSNIENKIKDIKSITIDGNDIQYFCFDETVIDDNYNEKQFLGQLMDKINEIKTLK